MQTDLLPTPKITLTLFLASVVFPFFSPMLGAQERVDKIAWYATWEAGVAEAKQSGRPILLMSAAPHCRNVSGIW